MNPKARRELEVRQAYKRLFESDDGKRVLEDMRHNLCADRTTFNANPTTHAFNEGGRYAVLLIENKMDVDKVVKAINDD